MGQPDASPQSYPADKVVITLLHVVAISSTVYRLLHRFKLRRLWWDDYLAFVPVVMDIYYSSSIWFRNFDNRLNGPFTSTRQLLDSYWLTTFPYLVIMWNSRTALILSLARTFLHKRLVPRWMFSLVAIMAVSFVSCLAITITACKHASSFLTSQHGGSCAMGTDAHPSKNVFIFAEDIFGNIILVFLPVVIIWRLELHSLERRLLLTVLYGSLLMLLVSIAFVALAFSGSLSGGSGDRAPLNIMAHVEAATAILVSNVVVLTTCLYQYIRYGQQTGDLSVPGTRDYRSSRSCSISHCICKSERSVTPITLTEISEFSSLHSSPHSSVNMDFLHDPLRRSTSQASMLDIRETDRSVESY